MRGSCIPRPRADASTARRTTPRSPLTRDRGILVGTPHSAALPALVAATSPDVQRAALYGPAGLGHLGGPPAEQPLYRPLRDIEEATRVWETSQALVHGPVRDA
jgi:hypothetical protein